MWGRFGLILHPIEDWKPLLDIQQLDRWLFQWLSSSLKARPERQTGETFTYEATDGQMKLSASRSGICRHQCVRPNIQSAKQASTVSQPLPVPSPPQLQNYVDWMDRAAEPGLWEHNGEVIQGFRLSLGAFVLTVELSSSEHMLPKHWWLLGCVWRQQGRLETKTETRCYL